MDIAIKVKDNNLSDRLKGIRDKNYPGLPMSKFFVQVALDSQKQVKVIREVQ